MQSGMARQITLLLESLVPQPEGRPSSHAVPPPERVLGIRHSYPTQRQRELLPRRKRKPFAVLRDLASAAEECRLSDPQAAHLASELAIALCSTWGKKAPAASTPDEATRRARGAAEGLYVLVTRKVSPENRKNRGFLNG